MLFTISIASAAGAAEYTVSGTRYLRKYTASQVTPAYMADADAQRIANTLCDVAWEKSEVKDATATTHVTTNLEQNAKMRERFDAALWCANHVGDDHMAYANAACYVFEFPQEYALPTLTNLSLNVYSDPYNAYGARISVMASDTLELPTDCATVRGEAAGGIKAAGVCPRTTRTVGGKTYSYSSTTNVVFGCGLPVGGCGFPVGGLQLKRYLFVFVLMENYATSRGNWLEGCSYIDNAVKIATSGEIVGIQGSATEEYAAGLMAFRDVEATVVERTDGRYVYDGPRIRVGDWVTNSSAWRCTYDCAGHVGVGTNLVAGPLHATNKVISIATSTIRLVHRQVYDLAGYDMTTCTEGGADTKEMTKEDKLAVADYRRANGMSGRAGALAYGSADTDGDGIPDGWELYVGSNPWDYGDRASDADGDGLDLADEWDGGHFPTDPNAKCTRGDNILDYWAHRYHLKGSDAAEDFDGDGLSNYSEYMISKVFRLAELDPDNPKTNGSCVDYFRKQEGGELYFGEMFTDHDQVDDAWERAHGMNANAWTWDATRDDDGDGWSNFAEAKAGTHPGAVDSPGVDGETKAEYPIPTVSATVVYGGKQSLTGPLVFQAWSQKTDPGMTGVPDAEWTARAGDAPSTTRYLGKNPCRETTLRLGTGVVKPGTVKIYFLDMAFEKVSMLNGVEKYSFRGEVGDAQWYYFVQDYNGELYTTVTNGTQTKVGTVDYATGEITVDYGHDELRRCVYERRANGGGTPDHDTKSAGLYSNYEKIDLSRSYVKMQWESAKITKTGNATYCLGAATGGKGHVREGLNKFVVFCDMDDDGKYTPGEPFGFVRDVDVGWQGGAFEVELTETSPVFARIDLRATATTMTGDLKATDRQVWQEGASSVLDISNGKYSDLCKKMGVTYKDGENVLDLSDTRLTRLRVMRVLVNNSTILGYELGNTKEVPVKQVVLDKYLDLGTRSYLHEGDFLTGSAYDADWATLPGLLETKARANTSDKLPKYIEVTNVTYAIVVGEGDVMNSSSNLVFRCLVNKAFDYGGGRMANDDGTPAATHVVRPVVDTVAPQNLIYGARPKFRFAMKDGYGNVYNSYTAFKIRIAGGGATYETGLRDLPPRDATGWYEWTLDEAIGAKLPASGNYTWQVALYNAKYQGGTYQTTKVTEWSASGTFTVDMNNQQAMNDHGYSSIAAAVKYAGPGTVIATVGAASTNRTGRCIVEAYETADFAGVAAGKSYAKANLADTASMATNAVVKGLPQNGTYYLRAFIDTNGNGVKDEWESWGAAKEPVTISQATRTHPKAVIWIEDADTDGDWYPDAYEMATHGNLTTKSGSIIGGDQIKFNGNAGATGTAGVSTGIGGATLTTFQNATLVNALMQGMTNTVSVEAIRDSVEGRVEGVQ